MSPPGQHVSRRFGTDTRHYCSVPPPDPRSVVANASFGCCLAAMLLEVASHLSCLPFSPTCSAATAVTAPLPRQDVGPPGTTTRPRSCRANRAQATPREPGHLDHRRVVHAWGIKLRPDAVASLMTTSPQWVLELIDSRSKTKNISTFPHEQNRPFINHLKRGETLTYLPKASRIYTFSCQMVELSKLLN
ncbi:hypothetical protein K402DRAFT_155617 [Aulographum hederae CBS 113979]|uniref:Uncharacterized protein n=1 Tax=Aulographum hederae CBS 113979 TaxID=1176131 RepID=A0A6G1GSJ7_9PEZI|nr:hypothetical protein K402DRAFT_155617 [Aulographum hederae CBS 113979]